MKVAFLKKNDDLMTNQKFYLKIDDVGTNAIVMTR